MRPWIALITLTALGCGAPAPDAPVPTSTERGDFQLELTYADGELHRGVNSFRVRAWEPAGAPVTLAEVVATMPSHDHLSSYATVSFDGTSYHVDDLRLTMPGRWEVTLRLAQGARTDVALVSVFIP